MFWAKFVASIVFANMCQKQAQRPAIQFLNYYIPQRGLFLLASVVLGLNITFFTFFVMWSFLSLFI